MARTFTDSPAVRSALPLLFGIIGPSSGGKTFSALRLATGMRKVIGKEIFCVDTEAKRALHYADKFKFRHVPFEAPFGSLDYLEVIKYCVGKGAGIVIIDSQSHEHEGTGGYLDTHDEEVKRLVDKGGFRSEYAASVPAWNVPANRRAKLINGVVQLGVNAIFCFRAKEKVDLSEKDERGGTKITRLGWQPIAGAAFVYEMTARCVLQPGSNGVPDWTPEVPGERALVKLPEQFRELFAKPHPLCEDDGEAMARWAAGKPAELSDDEAERKAVREQDEETPEDAAMPWIALLLSCTSRPEVTETERRMKLASLPESVRKLIRKPLADAKERVGA